MGILNRERTVH